MNLQTTKELQTKHTHTHTRTHTYTHTLAQVVTGNSRQQSEPTDKIRDPCGHNEREPVWCDMQLLEFSLFFSRFLFLHAFLRVVQICFSFCLVNLQRWCKRVCVCVCVWLMTQSVWLAVRQLKGTGCDAGTGQLKLTYWLPAVPVTLTLRDPEQVSDLWGGANCIQLHLNCAQLTLNWDAISFIAGGRVLNFCLIH